VDTEERVRAFLPQLDELVSEGLVTLDDCEVILPQSRIRSTGGAPITGRDDTPGESDRKGKKQP
jgi:uncharacterized protein